MKKSWLTIVMVIMLTLVLVPALASAESVIYAGDGKIVIGGTPINSGTYYHVNGDGKVATATGIPSDNYAYYNSGTGVLKLHNFNLTTANPNSPALGVTNDGSTYTMTIELSGQNSLTSTGVSAGMVLANVDCTITGMGSLDVTCSEQCKNDAVQFKSLTVDSSIKLNFTLKAQTGNGHALLVFGSTSLKKGELTATGPIGIESKNGITIEGSAKVSATGTDDYGEALLTNKTFSVKGGTVTSKSSKWNAVSAGKINITGGKVTVNESVGGLCANIGNDSELTIDGGIVEINTSGTCLYSYMKDINIKNGNLTLTSTEGVCFYTDVDGNGKIKISGGNITASAYSPALYGTAGIEISGGNITATSSASIGIYTYSDSANVTVSNGDVNVTADNVGIYAPATVTISNGNVKVKAGANAIRGNKGVTISGGNVTAISQTGAAVYTKTSSTDDDGNLSITGGTLAATTADSDWYSVQAAKKIIVDGDAVVYVYDTTSTKKWLDFKKGVVYTGVDVSLDSNGNRVLKDGVGTVYGNPNVTSFTKPTNSKLGTAFDEHVTITDVPDVPYSGSACMPEPTVKVNKIALNRELVKDADYTLASISTEDYTNVGSSKKYNIQAVDDSGNVGTKAFSFNVTPKELTWDTSDLTVSKYEDGTTEPATVSGTLTANGILDGDDVQVSYDSLTVSSFPASQAGAYALEVTVNGVKLSGADAGNYTLPNTFTLNAKIEPKPQATLPKTGDNSQVALWAALMALSAAGVAATLSARKRSAK